ncbi:CPBP family intramembrane glutamic endopeptidase [Microlunatus soli]|uniref:CAAX prenyl protease 2/Lysostaphin resistance protein A-like domain-containing protein n=1 Tax=Microlunatus soli TaxID=630515 RepID=A0A1H1ZUB0_9ACTN|nr:type II CAAX endopeptidase family protein [Microlunatus soli]SDT37250.1 hypothetical protein SAMN04489812_5457 [Microlunatus soli]
MISNTVENHAVHQKIGWPEVGVAALAGAVLYGVGILIIVTLPHGRPILAGLVQYAVSGLAPFGAFIAAVLLRIRDVRPFGLRSVAPRWLLVAVGAGVVVIGLNLAVTILLSGVTNQTVQSDYRSAATGGVASMLGALALGALLTPVGEELLFRGVLANMLSRYGPWVAVIGSAAVFAVAHGINYIMPVAFIVGIANALLLRRSGAIWPCLIVHAMNNANSVILPAVLS